MSRKSSLTLLLALCAVLALAIAGPGQAKIPLLEVKAEPTDTKERGKATGFNIHFELGGDEHIKDLVQQLPRGIETNQFNPTCTKAAFLDDNCPESSQVGASTVNLTAGGLPQEVSGRIFFLAPEGPNLPSLGIVLDSPPPFQKAFQIAEVRINKQLGVLESVIRDFPQTAQPEIGPPVPIRINSLDVQLKASFVKNPLTCTPATTRLQVTSYEDPGNPATASASYRPTGCAKLFRPRCNGVTATLTGKAGSETLRGTGGRDVIVGLGGNDVIKGRGGNDLICGGKGADRIFGAAGKDSLFGNAGADKLFGGPGADRLRGGPGRDVERP